MENKYPFFLSEEEILLVSIYRDLANLKAESKTNKESVSKTVKFIKSFDDLIESRDRKHN